MRQGKSLGTKGRTKRLTTMRADVCVQCRAFKTCMHVSRQQKEEKRLRFKASTHRAHQSASKQNHNFHSIILQIADEATKKQRGGVSVRSIENPRTRIKPRMLRAID